MGGGIMNKENNQRFRQTEDRVIWAFLELIKREAPEKVTVSEIVRLSDINRSSFYLHFQDIFGLMSRIDERLAARCVEIFTQGDGNWNIGERFARFFAFVKDNRDFYKVFLERSREIRVLDAALPEQALTGLAKVAEEQGFRSENEYVYHQAFFRAGLAAMLREWIARDCAETPEEMASILAREYAPDRGRFV